MDKQRFIVFTGSTYYPAPGWHDLYGRFDTLEEARSAVEKDSCDWWQIVDLSTNEIVAGEGEGHTGLFGLVPAVPVQ